MTTNNNGVSRRALIRLWFAWGGGVLFLLLAGVQGVLRPGYDARQQSLSALSLGPSGWIQQLNFVMFGALLLAAVPAWRVVLWGAKGARSYPALSAIAGLMLILAGLVPQDPAPGYDPMGLALAGPTARGLLHIAIAGVAAVASTAGLLILGNRLAGEPHWRGWAIYCWVSAILVVTSVAIYAIWSTSPTGYAGAFERLAVVIQLIWGAAFLGHLTRGTPLTHSVAATGGLHEHSGL